MTWLRDCVCTSIESLLENDSRTAVSCASFSPYEQPSSPLRAYPSLSNELPEVLTGYAAFVLLKLDRPWMFDRAVCNNSQQLLTWVPEWQEEDSPSKRIQPSGVGSKPSTPYCLDTRTPALPCQIRRPEQ